ncbi:hypothetical protein ACQVP2_28515 [Methylobacterium aquaticum]|uniref:hypothetical protein n=1 Tax=Methylobacterium aquaticum TaxID=270351 RepID=UPI003D186BE3
MRRTAPLSIVLWALAGLGSAHADGLTLATPSGPNTHGQCYASGTTGPRVPCVLQGQTWTRVLRPTDPADALTVGGTAISAILGGKAPIASPTFTGAVTAPVLNLPNTDGLRVGGAPLFSALPACTPGSTVAPVPAGQPFVCSGLVLIAQ